MQIEALNWLANNNHPGPLATNFFVGKDDAVNFVKELYDLGADDISINQKSIQNEDEGQYADSIIITINDQTKEKIIAHLEKTKNREYAATEWKITGNKISCFWD